MQCMRLYRRDNIHDVIVHDVGMLDHLRVDAYGERMSLKSLGSVSVRDSQLLAVSAFDPGVRRHAAICTDI